MEFLLTPSFRVGILSSGAIWLLLSSTQLEAQEFRLESAGARFGFRAESRTDEFYQTETFANFDLPWYWEFCSNWRLQSRLDLAAGWLYGHTDDAFVGSAGPSLVLSLGDFPVSMVGGASPNIISRHEFGRTDLGTYFQFTSHIGFNWDIGSHVQFGYRIQHMSNAGISSHNPGLNMHMFALSYRF